MFFLQGTSAVVSTPLWLLLSTQESGWRGQVAGGTAGATPSKPGVQHRAQGAGGRPGGQGVCRARHHPAPSPRAAGPHVPSVHSLRDLPRIQSHCFPTTLDPSVPAHSYCGVPPCSSPAACPREHTRAPVSRGHPAPESSSSHSEHTPGPSSGGLLFNLSFLFYKEKMGFLPLGPLW